MSAGKPARRALPLAFLGLGAAACGGGGGGGSGGETPVDAAVFAPTPDAAEGDTGPAAPTPDAAVTSPPDAAAPTGACAGDEACESEAYCAEGTCVAGCRVAPDNCRNTAGGLPQRCDADTRVCGAGPVTATGCEADADCAAGRYCDAAGACTAGCRPAPGDCGPFDTCDPASHTCRAQTCAEDTDCDAGAYCDAAAGGICLPGCRDGAECGAGFRCDEDHRCRAECAGEADCAAGEYCDAELHSCRVDCTLPGHQGCQPEEACDAATHQCRLACRDDAAEAGAGNDTADTASPVNVAADANRPGVLAGAVAGRVLCPGDPDFLAVTLPAPARTEVTLTWDTGPGDLSLRVTDAAGRALGQAEGTSPLVLRTQALGEAPDAADLRIAVDATSLTGPAAYGVTVRTAAPQTGCFPDALDPLDDRPANGRVAGQRPEARFVEQFVGSTCRGDVDWICFDLEANDGVRATLEGPEGAPLAIALYAADDAADAAPLLVGEALAAPGARGLEVLPESARLPNDRYCLRVAADAGAPDTQVEDWRLTLDFQRSAVRCGDPAEPNDAPGEAVELDGAGALAGPDGRLPTGVSLGLPDTLRLCPGDADVFRFEADAGDVLRAWIEGGPELENAEVALLDATGRARGDLGAVTPVGAAMQSTALAVAESPGPWFVRVRADAIGGGEYTLHVRRDLPGEGCSADFQEPEAHNEDATSAVGLAGPRADRFTVTNARLCSELPGQYDEDWYAFSVPAPGHRLCVEAGFRQRDGNVDAALYAADPAAAPCTPEMPCADGACIDGHCVAPRANARTQHDGEMIALGADETQPGAYFLRLYSELGEQNAYDLAVTLIAPTPECSPDFRERDRANDTADQATPLGAGRAHVCDAWLCADERQTGDWYRINVPAGEDRTVHVGFDGLSDGTVAVTLIDPANPEAGEVFVAEANTVAQCLNIRGGPDAGDLLVNLTAVRLADDGDNRLDYTLQVAPTVLGRDARGECDALSGGLYREIPWPVYALGL